VEHSIANFYERVPAAQRDLFLADQHKLFELSHNLSAVKDDYMVVKSDELNDLKDLSNYTEVINRLVYIPKIKIESEHFHGIEYGPNADALVIPSEMSLIWDVECPFIIQKLHYEHAYGLVSDGIGGCANALDSIRLHIKDVPKGLDIGQGTTFFTGNRGDLIRYSFPL
jgi:hypothetical protein